MIDCGTVAGELLSTLCRVSEATSFGGAAEVLDSTRLNDSDRFGWGLVEAFAVGASTSEGGSPSLGTTIGDCTLRVSEGSVSAAVVS